MKKINTSPISGMLELLPPDQAIFNQIKSKIAEAYRLHGFQNIETPSIDRNEILFAKAGGDTEKQIYRVIKTTESAEDSTESLKYDHTVTLARFVVEHESDLNFPFKVMQIGKNFRGERPQKGRYREFYQCDIDIIGRNNLSIHYDAEIINALSDALTSFISVPLHVRISNRKILSGLISLLDLEKSSAEIYSLIDHSEKVPAEKTKTGFKEVLKDEKLVSIFLKFIDCLDSADEDAIITALEKILKMAEEYLSSSSKKSSASKEATELYRTGISELVTVCNLLNHFNIGRNVYVTADMRIVRGLDYYTGTVFETVIDGYEGIGSVCSGGRYENLTSYYSDQKFPGVGGSIGLTRMFATLKENGLIKEKSPLVDYAIVPFFTSEHQEELRFFAEEVAATLRKDGKSVDVILAEKKLRDQLSYASKIAKNVIVIGENELESRKVKAKDFATGKESELNLDF
ncbi:histidine--tRNA ligase [Candidatus Saccharibacteria bacterium]|nr:histidine--tRNA ligase [Candidatus Saccharibacteria bacterium]